MSDPPTHASMRGPAAAGWTGLTAALLLIVSLAAALHAAPLGRAPSVLHDTDSSPTLATSEVLLQTDRSVTVGHPLSWIEAADLNGDDLMDLAVANGGDGPGYPSFVSIMLGDGDATFGAREDFATGKLPIALAIADLDRDGRPDVVTTNHESNTISVLLGQGGGSLGERTDYPTLGSPQWAATADLNADGHLDVVTANGGGGTINVLLGNGDGTFQPRSEAFSECYPYSVAIGDLDGDGRPDLAAVTDCGKTQVLMGRGDGTFGPWTTLDQTTIAQYHARSLAIADLDGDGSLDLAISGYRTSVLFGNGDGTFHARIDVDGQGSWPPTRQVQAADMNRDGHLDLVTCSQAVSVLPGIGDGTFGSPTRFEGVSYAMAIADFNADGWLDLAARSGPHTVTVLLNQGSPVSVPGGGLALAIRAATGNPSSAGPLRVEFTLGAGTPARLELVDVAGRVLVVEQVGYLGPGIHALDLSPSVALRSGVYFLRLTQDGNEARAKAAVLR